MNDLPTFENKSLLAVWEDFPNVDNQVILKTLFNVKHLSFSFGCDGNEIVKISTQALFAVTIQNKFFLLRKFEN